MPKTVVFLGAGASVAEGASKQADLFKDYFMEKRLCGEKIGTPLQSYFKHFWAIDLQKGDLAAVVFPTFEEALGMLEMARDRGEGFRGFYSTPDSNMIGRTIENLVFLIAEILHRRLQQPSVHHVKLIRRFQTATRMHDVTFISLNYDILIDNAITRAHPAVDLDYGIEFGNFGTPDDWSRPRPEHSILLLKVHGSLNWLYCPVCKAIWITPKRKGVIELISRQGGSMSCHRCGGHHVPILIPPTFFKVMSNPHLVAVWEKAEESLRLCDRIVFCGYSLPDADIHIKYLLKRGQLNRAGKPPTIVVVNNHPGKTKDQSADEKVRYTRLFGPRCVDYTELSFEKFVQKPALLLA